MNGGVRASYVDQIMTPQEIIDYYITLAGEDGLKGACKRAFQFIYFHN